VYTRDELVTHILYAIAFVKKREETQTNNTRSSHASCKVYRSWRWDFRTFVL